MNFEPDDPKLTAYALGELDGAELREMEAHLMEDPAARRVVEEIRASAELLGAGFTRERVEGLNEKQRAAVGAVPKVLHLHARKTVASAASRGWRPGWPVALGGVAALVMTGVFLFTNGKPESLTMKLGYKHAADAEMAKTATSHPGSEAGADRSRDYAAQNEGTSSTAPVNQPVVTRQDELRAKTVIDDARRLGSTDTNGAWGNPDPLVIDDSAKIQNARRSVTKVGDQFDSGEKPTVLFSNHGNILPSNRDESLPTPPATNAKDYFEAERQRLMKEKPAPDAQKPASQPLETVKVKAEPSPVVSLPSKPSDVVVVDLPKTQKVSTKLDNKPLDNVDDHLTSQSRIPPARKLEEVEITKLPKPKEEAGGGGVGGIELVDTTVGNKGAASPGSGGGWGGGNGKGAGNGQWGERKRNNEREEPAVKDSVRQEDRFKHTIPETPATKPDPNTPLNPLGYAERPAAKPEWQNELRYDGRYRSFIPPVFQAPPGGEEYARIHDNTFLDTGTIENRLSTFAIDVDTAAYSNVRRFLNQNQLPPADAVRVEEMVNYFKYDYSAPTNGKPFNVFMEVARCPWNSNHKLARIGVKAVDLKNSQRPASNLVFLIDVSGSMEGANRLPLVKSGLKELVKRLDENDRISIVTYSDSANVLLAQLPGNHQEQILRAIENLRASGSTNGADGIQQAYRLAVASKMAGGVNRVILATDGDFNVGITDKGQLTDYVADQAKQGVFLTVLGYGMGNIKDAMLEQLANKGNGHYAYIDDQKESQRVLIEQMNGTLVTVAKDVKLQVEFNPARVRGHRLIGYENRKLAHADFNNDTKDAGELGAGHTVTALYEIIPTRSGAVLPGVDPLKYLPADGVVANTTEDLLTLKVRYKLHNQDTSNLLEFPVADQASEFTQATKDFRFAASVAAFGMLLRGSPFRGSATFDDVMSEAAANTKGMKEREEFIELVRKARNLMNERR